MIIGIVEFAYDDAINTYEIIHEDLNRYYESGRTENKECFINLFRSLVKNSKYIESNKRIPTDFEIYGDYWNIELINSLLISGKLNEIDPEIFKNVSRFHSVHKNMIDYINRLNEFYDQQVVPNLDKGEAEFYAPNNGKFKMKYQRLIEYQEMILSLSEASVDMAEALRNEIKTLYL